MLSAVVAAEAAAASVLTSPPSHTSAASAAAAAPVAAVRPLQPRGSLQRAPGAGEALDMHLIIKNLDSGEACHVSEASAVFPEVQQAARAGEAATRPATAAGAAAVAVAAPAAAAAAQEQEHEVASSNGSSGGSGRGFWSLFRRGKKDTPAEQGEATAARGRMGKRVKVKAKKKAVQELSALTLRQQVPYHSGPIWTMKWSPCGAFLATAGHDGVIAVWAVAGSPAAQEIANRPSGADSGNYLAAAAAAQAANTAAAEAAASQQAAGGAGASVSVSGSEAEASTSRAHSSRSQSTSRASSVTTNGSGSGASGGAPGAEAAPLLHPVPYLVWVGHKADVVDLSWSAGYFLLSASIDKTVRLWHISRPKCILIFQHTDFVTSVAFHPVDDRYFLSGSFDKRLRIWSVPQHRVVEWAQAPAIITAAAFSPDGADAVAGLAHGQVVVYRTEQLKYRTQIECKNRSGKHKAGRKVTGLEFSPNGHYLLVTTNDSRIRLVNFKDFSLESKYKGLQNEEMQLRASFSPNGSRIVCGSEDGACFLWETLTGANGKDNHIEACESFAASEPGAELVTVTCAMFVPFAAVQTSAASAADLRATTHIFATAGFDGAVRFFENKAPPVKL
jgi:WD40 repeat protein